MNSDKFIAEYNELKTQAKKYYNDVVKDDFIKFVKG